MYKIISREEAKRNGLVRYFTGVKCIRGHICERYTNNGGCVECEALRIKNFREHNQELVKKWNKDSKSKPERKARDRIYRKNYYEKNKEREKQKKNDWYKKNSEKAKEYARKHRLDNKEYYANYVKNKRQQNNEYWIVDNCRRRVNEVIALSKTQKKDNTIKLIGCKISELKEYLEKKFKKGMSWENKGEWQIDHVVPVKYFRDNYNLTDINIQKICFHYSNLQPMWSKHNQSKGDKVNPLFAEEKISEIKKLINA